MAIFHVVVTTTYEADALDLAERFPVEFDDFIDRGGSGQDQYGWVLDCYEAGGTELFEYVDSSVDIYRV